MLISNHFLVQHKYHTKIDDLIEKAMNSMRVVLVGKLISVLESVLSKLGRYDEGNLIGSFLTFTVRTLFFLKFGNRGVESRRLSFFRTSKA